MLVGTRSNDHVIFLFPCSIELACKAVTIKTRTVSSCTFPHVTVPVTCSYEPSHVCITSGCAGVPCLQAGRVPWHSGQEDQTDAAEERGTLVSCPDPLRIECLGTRLEVRECKWSRTQTPRN